MIYEVRSVGHYIEALPRSPFAVRRFSREFCWWEIAGPTPATVKATGESVTIVALEWFNEHVQMFRSSLGTCYMRNQLDIVISPAPDSPSEG